MTFMGVGTIMNLTAGNLSEDGQIGHKPMAVRY